MGNDDGVGIVKDRTFEHFPRVDKGCVESSPADHLHAVDLVFDIKVQCIELLDSVFVDTDAAEEVIDIVRTQDRRLRIGMRGFPDEFHGITGNDGLVLFSIEQ